MAKKKGNNNPWTFESTGSSNRSARIYYDMALSEAYKDLGANARDLYQHMKMEFYGANTKEYPTKQDVFYFPKSLYIGRYGLYKNGAQFQRDLKKLVSHGFIKVIERGSTTRTENIYQFSDEWKNWKPE